LEEIQTELFLLVIGISFLDIRKEILDEKDIPILESYYEKYWVGNYKGGIKIIIPYKDKQYIQQHYVNR